MTIKEVEKQTGLTAKSIRYYESKGLLTVERNTENSYRSYSPKEIHRLKQIKLFRYLDFSIEQIRELLDGEESQIQKAFSEKAELFYAQREACESKREICLSLAKDYSRNEKVIEEYDNAINFLESDELEETVEAMKKYSCPNLSASILYSLIFLAPVFWLFYHIRAEQYDGLLLNAIVAVIGIVFVTLNWYRYVTYYHHHRNRVRQNNRDWAWMGPAIIVMLILGVSLVIGISILAEKIIVSKNYLFYEHQPVASVVLICLIMLPVILVVMLFVAKIRKKTPKQMEDMNDILFLWNHLGKWKPVIVGLWIFLLYLCLCSVTVVTENEIVYHSPLHPAGIAYPYTAVEKISTGFGDKTFAIAEYKRKGNFYYQISLDGRTITFHVPSDNGDITRYEEDSYLELEEFDEKLVALGIPKTGSKEGYENCDYDNRYVERFLRIIAR